MEDIKGDGAMLTEKQKKVLGVINTYIEKYNFSPTVRELAEMMNLKSTATMHQYLERLKAKNYITWHEGSPRTIQVLNKEII